MDSSHPDAATNAKAPVKEAEEEQKLPVLKKELSEESVEALKRLANCEICYEL